MKCNNREHLLRAFPTFLLLLSLVGLFVAIPANAVGVYPDNPIVNNQGGFRVYLTGNSKLKFQLDSDTYLLFTCYSAPFETGSDCELAWNVTYGRWAFRITSFTTIFLQYFGNVSYVFVNAVGQENNTYQMFGPAPSPNFIKWFWTYTTPLTGTQYELTLNALDIIDNFTSIPGVTAYINDTVNTMPVTLLLDGGNYYQITVEETYPYNNTAYYEFAGWTDGFNESTRIIYLAGSTSLHPLYRAVLLPDYTSTLIFGMGLAGFVMLGIMPFLVYYFYKQEQYDMAFLVGFGLGLFGFGLIHILFGG